MPRAANSWTFLNHGPPQTRELAGAIDMIMKDLTRCLRDPMFAMFALARLALTIRPVTWTTSMMRDRNDTKLLSGDLINDAVGKPAK